MSEEFTAKEGLNLYKVEHRKNDAYYLPGGEGAKAAAKRHKHYFFLDGKLHEILSSNRALDIIQAWSFEEYKIVQYSRTYVTRKMKQAYSMREVCAMLSISRPRMNFHILDGVVPVPSRIKKRNKDLEENRGPRQRMNYFWSDDDIIKTRDAIAELQWSQKKKDGTLRKSRNMPSAVELRAMLRNNSATFVRNSDGEFIPVWKQPDWG